MLVQGNTIFCSLRQNSNNLNIEYPALTQRKPLNFTHTPTKSISLGTYKVFKTVFVLCLFCLGYRSFNGTFRSECLDRWLFADGQQAQTVIEQWRLEYNHHRPHSSLGYLPPAVSPSIHPLSASPQSA
ncbi:MAG: transposase [Anaerolineaceae bacterium]|nr:transposase [Anaerolineaceae bacterium]